MNVFIKEKPIWYGMMIDDDGWETILLFKF